jgi:hypothetical protein
VIRQEMAKHKFPIFIISRDRLDPLEKLLTWLEKSGSQSITILDNASTYPPILAFFEQCQYRVIRYKKNWGHKIVTKSAEIKRASQSGYYVITDPDVLPRDTCPLDAIEYFYELLQKYPDYRKAGFGLCIDDLPDYYAHKEQVIRWERQFWSKELEKDVYNAPIDTTFALYRPGLAFAQYPSIRTGGEYMARHLPWYTNSNALSAEEQYYRLHARKDVSNWNQEQLPDFLLKMIERQK